MTKAVKAKALLTQTCPAVNKKVLKVVKVEKLAKEAKVGNQKKVSLKALPQALQFQLPPPTIPLPEPLVGPSRRIFRTALSLPYWFTSCRCFSFPTFPLSSSLRPRSPPPLLITPCYPPLLILSLSSHQVASGMPSEPYWLTWPPLFIFALVTSLGIDYLTPGQPYWFT